MEIFHHPDRVYVRVLTLDGGQDVARADEGVVDDVLQVMSTRFDGVNALGRTPADDGLILMEAFGA